MWTTPTFIEVSLDSAEFQNLAEALDARGAPRPPIAWQSGTKLVVGTELLTDAHRHRPFLIDIDARGRPPRNRTNDAKYQDFLLTFLRKATLDDLRGRRGQPTAEACELYLEVRLPTMPRELIRRAVKVFLANN
jgi:hypothetical protein